MTRGDVSASGDRIAVWRDRLVAAGTGHLYISYAGFCLHRTAIVRALIGLEDVVSMSVADRSSSAGHGRWVLSCSWAEDGVMTGVGVAPREPLFRVPSVGPDPVALDTALAAVLGYA